MFTIAVPLSATTMTVYSSPFPSPPPVPDLNVHHAFFNRPEQSQWPDFTFHIDARTDKRVSYRQFLQNVKDGMTALASPVSSGGLGVGRDEIVGIMSDNSLEYPILVHALLGVGVPFSLISAYSTRFELVHAFKLSKITRLFVQPKYLPLALNVSKEIGLSPKRIYTIGGTTSGYRSLLSLIDRVRKVSPSPVPVADVQKDDLAYLVFSSGTSGLPKAVMITHGNLIFSIYQAGIIGGVLTAAGIKPQEPSTPEGIPITLAFLPFHHSYGLHAFIFRHLLVPSTVVIMPKWEIETALKIISKYHITTINLIPSVIHQLIHHPSFASADLSSVTYTSSGAAYLPPELAAKFASYTKNVPGGVAEGYGLSEATIAALMRPPPSGLPGIPAPPSGSAGVLLPGMQARLVREDDSDAPVGEVGELWLKGENVCKGYWGNPKATEEALVNEGGEMWLKTGDGFSVDERGFFFFSDRRKDTLKISGTQVSPTEIESVFLAHPLRLISDVSVAGVSGHGRTSDEKVPRAWVVLSDAGKALVAKKGKGEVVKELEKWQEESLSKYKWCRGGIEIVREIPKSPTGKVLRRVLVERYEKRFKGVGAKAKL